MKTGKMGHGTPSRLCRSLLLLCVVVFSCGTAQAVPSFARQTHLPCSACHVGGFGPQLTTFGRQFKLMGYTMKSGHGPDLPLSAMLVESYTHTLKAQPQAPAAGFGTNNNLELQQASVFLAGRLSTHMGVLAQATYSENGGLLGWDNADLRYARMFKQGKHSGIWGISLNNNPSLSDVFNTAPAWQFPYISADLAPGAPAAPILLGGLAGQVVGASAYVQLDGAWYVEAGGYRSLSPAFLRSFNGDFAGRLTALAPYARVAYTWNIPSGTLELGGFALSARRGLLGTNLAGHAVALAGPSDSFRDLGMDASLLYSAHADHQFTVNALFVDERQRLNATYATGGSSNLHDSLRAFNLNGSYWYRNTWGATLGAFANNGSADSTLYGVNRRPDTQGEVTELDWNPFGQAGSWGAPWANLRVGLQYVLYTRFSGAVNNIDGAGRRARDNNTLYGYVWLAF